jgi:hypothetical protein
MSAVYPTRFEGLDFMRIPLRSKAPQREQVTRITSQSAPVRGWNARDALANMRKGDAIRLLNWWPTTTDLVIRGGNSDHLTGMTGVAETLAVYNAMNGTNKMFAATDLGIFDASSAGAVGASVATSTNGYWQYTNFGDGTNNWLIMVNGVDSPNYYNGSAWTAVTGISSPALTGLTTTDIVHVFAHLGRLFFIQKNSLSFWYLSAGSAGGALTEFDLSSIATKGGYLIAGGTWSMDSGSGPTDRAVFITSEGEVIVYIGTNPGSAATWEKVGTYFLGKPRGRRCVVQYGGDLIIITENGAFPLSAILQSQTVEFRLALSDKIVNAFNEASRTYGANVGWEGIHYPARAGLIFNIPIVTGTESKQYAMNTTTQAWCEFDSWDAACFAVFNGDLYFGKDGGVQKAWTGVSDDGENIIADAKEAFSKFGSDSQKECTLFRPILQVNGSFSFLTGLDVDFKDAAIVGEATYTVTSGAQWDVSNWDEAYWAANLDIIRDWQSPQENFGTWFAGKIRISTNSLEVHWIASDYALNFGSGI